MSETTTKIRLKSILIHRAEGNHNECVTVNVASFADAESVIRGMARTAPESGGYHKTDVTVEFESGAAFRHRFDMTRKHATAVDLAGEIRRELEFYAGRWRPERITVEQHLAIIQRYPAAQQVRFVELLDQCEWR